MYAIISMHDGDNLRIWYGLLGNDEWYYYTEIRRSDGFERLNFSDVIRDLNSFEGPEWHLKFSKNPPEVP